MNDKIKQFDEENVPHFIWVCPILGDFRCELFGERFRALFFFYALSFMHFRTHNLSPFNWYEKVRVKANVFVYINTSILCLNFFVLNKLTKISQNKMSPINHVHMQLN